MKVVLGYPGSGTKMVARGLAMALVGDESAFRDEPLQLGVLQRYLRGLDSWEVTERLLRHLLACISHESYPVVKDEFCVPLYMEVMPCSAYVVRETLGNVAFLSSWPHVRAWAWYWQGLIREYRDLAEALWPEGAPEDDLVATLAVAHEIQVAKDLAAAARHGVPVYRFEDLVANYAITWAALLSDLGIEPKDEFSGWLQHAKDPLYTPFTNDITIVSTVRRVEERASKANLKETVK